MGKFYVPEKAIYICTGSKCSKRGSKEHCKEIKSYIKKSGLKDKIEVIQTECTDRCKFAPVLSAQPGNIWLKEYSGKEISELIAGLKEVINS